MISSGNWGEDIVRSTDGTNWYNLRMPSTGNIYHDVCFGAGLFVAVGNDIKYSSDGLSWTHKNLGLNALNSLSCVYYANNMFVAISGGTSPAVYTSTDGMDWTLRSQTLGNNYYIRSVSYGSGVWVAVGRYTIFSYDGITWYNLGLYDTDRRGICFGIDKFATATYAQAGALITGASTANFSASLTRGFGTITPISFTDLSSGATSWLWDFGDGETSTDQNPTHTYGQLGSYTVSLTIGTIIPTGGANTNEKPNYITWLGSDIRVDVSSEIEGDGTIESPFTYNQFADVYNSLNGTGFVDFFIKGKKLITWYDETYLSCPADVTVQLLPWDIDQFGPWILELDQDVELDLFSAYTLNIEHLSCGNKSGTTGGYLLLWGTGPLTVKTSYFNLTDLYLGYDSGDVIIDFYGGSIKTTNVIWTDSGILHIAQIYNFHSCTLDVPGIGG